MLGRVPAALQMTKRRMAATAGFANGFAALRAGAQRRERYSSRTQLCRWHTQDCDLFPQDGEIAAIARRMRWLMSQAVR